MATIDSLNSAIPPASNEAEINLLASGLIEKINSTEAALQANDPNINNYCAMIWSQLLKCPELTYILPPESIGTFIRTLSKRAAIEVTKPVATKASKTAMKNTTLDDLL